MRKFQIIWLVIFGVTSIVGSQTCTQKVESDRFDCYPEDGSNEKGCMSRGCCWNPRGRLNSILQDYKSGTDVPYCFFPDDFPEYRVVSSAKLGGGLVYSIQKENNTFRPNEILKLEARVSYDTKQRLRVRIVDPNNARYQVPGYDFEEKPMNDDTDYQVAIGENPFSIKVYRKSTSRIIFDTSVAPLIYADQYIQFSTILPNNYFFGIGEHRDNLAHKAVWKSFTMWNRDTQPRTNTNLYGTHPFYLTVEPDGNAMGFFLVNSNGMDISVQPMPALTFTTIGGIIDFYLYLGPSPADVVAQHTEIVGRSQFPQYFTLGFHLCRWKYNSSDRIKEIIRRNRAAGIPYDVQWTDIDAMSHRMDWTYDEKNFSSLPDVVRDLHAHGQHYINIIDPAITLEPGYYPYDSGLKNKVFIRPADKEEPLVGVVWPGVTVFPDFTHPNATTWWSDLAFRFHQVVPFDGLWIDMNEPSNFVDGSVKGCTNSTYDNPPYTPRVDGQVLASRTVCPSARQYISNHYNLHNMYGHFESIASYAAMRAINPNKRPFVLTRSSFAGTGHYAAHWSGDNRANWDDLYYSIPNMLNFNMFGVAQVGSDICGFTGDTNEELCIRWMQLGSFYPFMRNHNDDTAKDQDPGAFSLNAQKIMRDNLNLRYTVLPYLYTLFYRASVYGETVVRPLFFEFPTDPTTLTVDRQFMFGPGLLITPCLEQGAEIVNDAYFPANENWYRIDSGQAVEKPGFQSLAVPLSDIGVHIRGGYIIPIQYPAVTTTESRKNPFGLWVALKKGSPSLGSLFWDDGESVDSIESNRYNLFNFMAKDGNVQVDKIKDGYKTGSKMILSEVKVFGVSKQPANVTINQQMYDLFTYDDVNQVLQINYFQVDMLETDSISVSWFY